MASFNTGREIISRAISKIISLEVPFAYRGEDLELKYIENLNDIKTVVQDGVAATVTGSAVPDNESYIYYQENFQNLNEALVLTIEQWVNCYAVDTDVDGIYDDWQVPMSMYDVGSSPITVISTETDPLTQYPIIDRIVLDNTTCTVGPNIIPILDIIKSNLLSQFLTFAPEAEVINPEQAAEVLDTEINELMSKPPNREQEISDFFTAYSRLKGPKPGGEGLPNYDIDVDNDGITDSFSDEQSDIYSSIHDWTPDNPGGYIPRTQEDSNDTFGTTQKSLQWLRDDLTDYLKDFDNIIDPDVQDSRPLYNSVSDGYLKVRNVNQSIIVRRQEGDDIGIIGADPDNPEFRKGFTITMWVKFLDKVSNGTLFNFGNPLREENPFGFSLKTEIVKQSDWISEGYQHPVDWFQNGDTERILKLIVHDGSSIRDSHFGIPSVPNSTYNVSRKRTTVVNGPDYENILMSGIFPFQHTRIPIDFNEWYFVVASYDPTILEDESFQDSLPTGGDVPSGDGGPEAALRLSSYWNGNWDPIVPGGYVTRSGYGTKCRVEYISKTDFIRARGFKQE